MVGRRNSLDLDILILAVFVDLKRAFGVIDRILLLMKLAKMGVSSECLDWFADFLKDRFQCVKIEDIMSDLLFIIFINSLPKV